MEKKVEIMAQEQRYVVLRNNIPAGTFTNEKEADYHRYQMERVSFLLKRFHEKWTVQPTKLNVEELNEIRKDKSRKDRH